MDLGYNLMGCISALCLCVFNLYFASMRFKEKRYLGAGAHLILFVLLLGTLTYTIVTL